jgi:hypothetical protein
MFTYSNLDRSAFQKLLANAFAVQQSQMDKQWLSAIVEIQGLISKRELDVDGTMQLIVDRAQTVANANGVAIALFKGHQLVYRAGSGSAIDYVGRQVMATLSVPADTTGGREILRVEDAETDTRIQAEICRQFGAKSLLILLIYHEQSVAGVLEVFFSEAHAFQECEVRAYRLMSGLVSEAMSQASHLERERLERERITTAPLPTIPNVAIPSPTIPNAAIPNPAILNMAVPKMVQQGIPQGPELLKSSVTVPGADWDAIPQPGENAKAVTPKFSIFRQPALLGSTLMKQVKHIPWGFSGGPLAAAAVAAVLVLASAVAYHHPRPASSLGSAGSGGVQVPIVVEPQPAVLRVKEVSTSGTSTLQTAPVLIKPAGTSITRLRRTRVGEDAVDYIGDDVTIRYFTTKPRTHPVRVGSSEVAYIGDDVTVRYFKPKAGTVTPTQSIGAAPLQKQ